MKLIMRKPDVIADIEALDRVMEIVAERRSANLDHMARLVAKINANDEKYLLVAEDAETGTLCGSLLGVIFEDICGEGEPILLVENVAVLPQYQRRGVASAMFEEIERWAREFGCHYEILTSNPKRKGAHEFYRAIGFMDYNGFKKYL